MKKSYAITSFILLCLWAFTASGSEPSVKQTIVNVTNANMRLASPMVLNTVIFDVPVAGRIILRFDGYCVSDSGDRIILAASNTPNWTPDDGNVGVLAPHQGFKRRAFSHTRVYDVAMGLDTFYAVGQNYVDKNGSGIASVYGHLTLEYFPVTGPALVIDSNINFSGDVRSVQRVLAKVFSPLEPAGKVLVHMDGQLYSEPGDRIMLTAANMPSWLVDAGSVAAMALSSTQRLSTFSHSRVYAQNASPDTFYAVAKNVVNQQGSGTVGVSGNLSAVFYPTAGIATIDVRSILEDDLDARGAAVAFDSITINAPVDGFALAQLDGYCTTSVGDEMLFAVNDRPDWEVNEGHITVSAPYTNNVFSTLSHSRLFPVTAGTHTFYSVVENTGLTGGNGLADILANFTVKFYPEINVGIQEAKAASSFNIYPNPANDVLMILFNDNNHTEKIEITDIAGRVVQAVQTEGNAQMQLNISQLPAGVYLVRSKNFTRKLVKQ
ncbi:MAG: T9SS type A sorting domain-containing protein [Chitinophagales bacterium]|nr:T9SS type A sorting domain-containing protein [Chitinophagales bacterium]